MSEAKKEGGFGWLFIPFGFGAYLYVLFSLVPSQVEHQRRIEALERRDSTVTRQAEAVAAKVRALQSRVAQ